MFFEDNSAKEARDKRRKMLSLLLGLPETQVEDGSLTGRLAIIAKLKAARRGEVSRGQAGSWLYDVNRHLNLCAALRMEYRDLAGFLAENARDRADNADGPASPYRGQH